MPGTSPGMTVWGKAGDTKADDGGNTGVPDFVSRVAHSAGNPLVLKAFPEPDSSGTSPGMTTYGKGCAGETAGRLGARNRNSQTGYWPVPPGDRDS